MELDDLLEQEGLDGGGAEEALQWARARAEQLVREMGEDPELGPLLSGAAEVPEAAPAEVHSEVAQSAEPELEPGLVESPVEPEAYPEVTQSTEPDLLEVPVEPGVAQSLPDDELDTTAPVVTGTDTSVPIPEHVIDPPSYGLTVAQAELAAAEAELAAAQAELAAIETDSAAEVEQPELDPLAGIDFDSMPSEDEDEDGEAAPSVMEVPLGSLPLPQGDTLVPTEAPSSPAPEEAAGLPDATIPSMQAPLDAHDVTLATMSSPDVEGVDVTVRAANPLDRSEHEAPLAAGQDEDEEEEIEEIELLDDDMIELVEEDEDEEPSAAGGDDGEIPEWQAALTSAQLGGGQKADEDSGLLRPPTHAPAPEPAPAPDAGDDDEDVDLGDL